MAYTGTLSDLNKLKDWSICDGTNGTPNLQGRFLEGVSSISNIKSLHEAGLPNITGRTGSIENLHKNSPNTYWPLEGAFYQSTTNVMSGNDPNNVFDNDLIGFDASRCSPIYGKSTTVQPASYTVVYIMKVK